MKNSKAILKSWHLFFGAFLLFGFSGCAVKEYVLEMMPAPDVYGDGQLDPFVDLNPILLEEMGGILYATGRAPVGEKSKERFYLNKRGHVVRLGIGNIALAKKNMTWEEAQQISLLKNRSGRYPIKVTGVEEYGMLGRSLGVFAPPDMLEKASSQPETKYVEKINNKLRQSKNKNIFVYLHGYKVNFENPVLVASEL